MTGYWELSPLRSEQPRFELSRRHDDIGCFRRTGCLFRLALNKADSGYTLLVTSGTLTSATSNTVSVTPGTATQLLITNQPATIAAGIGFEITVSRGRRR